MRIGFDLDGTLADMQTALAREASALFPDLDPSSLPSSAPESVEPKATGSAVPKATGSAVPKATGSAVPKASGSAVPQANENAEPQANAGVNAPLNLTGRQQRALWAAVRARDNFWETLDEIEPGALARLCRLVRERRWELIFLTSRPETAGDSAQMQSYRWLKANGFECPSVFVVHGSRGKIATALNLDAFVDDRPENCLDIAIESSARAILVWRGDESEVPGNARQLGIGVVPSIASCLDILERLDESSSESPGIVDRLKRLFGIKSKAARSPVAAAAASDHVESVR